MYFYILYIPSYLFFVHKFPSLFFLSFLTFFFFYFQFYLFILTPGFLFAYFRFHSYMTAQVRCFLEKYRFSLHLYNQILSKIHVLTFFFKTLQRDIYLSNKKMSKKDLTWIINGGRSRHDVYTADTQHFRRKYSRDVLLIPWMENNVLSFGLVLLFALMTFQPLWVI